MEINEAKPMRAVPLIDPISDGSLLVVLHDIWGRQYVLGTIPRETRDDDVLAAVRRLGFDLVRNTSGASMVRVRYEMPHPYAGFATTAYVAVERLSRDGRITAVPDHVRPTANHPPGEPLPREDRYRDGFLIATNISAVRRDPPDPPIVESVIYCPRLGKIRSFTGYDATVTIGLAKAHVDRWLGFGQDQSGEFE